MTTVILVRHGQSEGNLLAEFHGQYNSDLTEKGHAQAECTAKYLDAYHIDKIYSSDIRRAHSTALHTAKHKNLDVILTEGMREIKAGKWEQMKFADISVEYPELYHVWYNDISKCRCPDGESVAELFERVVKTFKEIVAKNDGKTVMIATHATPIRAMFCHIDGKDVSEMQSIRWVPNASVTVVECDGNSYNVVLRGEYSHLEKEGLVTELPKNI